MFSKSPTMCTRSGQSYVQPWGTCERDFIRKWSLCTGNQFQICSPWMAGPGPRPDDWQLYKRKERILTQRHREEGRGDRGREVATNEGEPRIARSHQGLNRSKEGLFLRDFRETMAVSTPPFETSRFQSLQRTDFCSSRIGSVTYEQRPYCHQVCGTLLMAAPGNQYRSQDWAPSGTWKGHSFLHVTKSQGGSLSTFESVVPPETGFLQRVTTSYFSGVSNQGKVTNTWQVFPEYGQTPSIEWPIYHVIHHVCL